MEINLFNNYGDIKFDYQKITNDISSVFDSHDSLSVILINNEEIHHMNKEYRNCDYPTDVLSFPDRDDDYIGDIFISIDKVYEQASSYEHSVEREFAFLLTHGILHLLGYDHLTKEEEQIMFSKQEEILNKTNYRRD
ncbi:MAG TPA: rRNA maturation RNase YbeY [Bacilli bacterium]